MFLCSTELSTEQRTDAVEGAVHEPLAGHLALVLLAVLGVQLVHIARRALLVGIAGRHRELMSYSQFTVEQWYTLLY